MDVTRFSMHSLMNDIFNYSITNHQLYTIRKRTTRNFLFLFFVNFHPYLVQNYYFDLFKSILYYT